MTEIPFKYGFPLFSLDESIISFNGNKILSSDIWSFWDYTIKQRFPNLKDRQIPQALLSQAKTFYFAAEEADRRSQPLLYYYSFLNFTKMGIFVHKKFSKSQKFDHGIESKNGSQKSFRSDFVRVTKRNSGTSNPKQRSTCYEILDLVEDDFCFLNGRPIDLNVKSLFNHCIGVHRAYSNVYSEAEVFVNLRTPTLYKSGKQLIFTGSFDDDVNSANLDELEQIYGSAINKEGKCFEVIYECQQYGPNKKDYEVFSKKLRELGIWYYISQSGYELYLSKKSSYRYSPEFIIYAIMFYLGSITRYHPYLFEDIFSEKDQWVVSEFLATQPKQFLYLFSSKVLGIELLEPQSNF